MRILTNTTLVKRNATIARYATTGGLVLLVGALLLNFYAITRPQESQLLLYVVSALFVGYTLSNIGGALNNRWGRQTETNLASHLRGLDDRHTLYNYQLGAAHVLVAPSGVYVLQPKYQSGPIAFEGGKWKQAGGRSGLLGLFNRDVLGNPAAEAKAEVDSLLDFLKKRVPEAAEGIEPRGLVVFLNPQAVISADDAPVTALPAKQLKDFIRRQPKGPTLKGERLALIDAKLGLTPAPAEE